MSKDTFAKLFDKNELRILNDVRKIQMEKNYKKLIFSYISIFVIGFLLFVVHSSYSDKDSFAVILLSTYGFLDIILGVIGTIIWYFTYHFGVHKKLGRWYCEVMVLFPCLLLILEDSTLIVTARYSLMPFMCFALIWMFYIIIYDMPAFVTSILIIGVSFIFNKGMEFILQGEMLYVGILYVTAIIAMAFILDRFSIDNIKSQFDLQSINDGMQKAIDDAVLEVSNKEKELKEIQSETIIGLANLIETRSGETGGHVKRTQKFMEILVEKALEQGLFSQTLDRDYANLCIDAACLHDIGKIRVPDDILNAPRKLTPEEFEVIKKHTVDGEIAIKDVLGKIEDDEYLLIAIQIAGGHHERWDGKGYPRQLSGYDIPLCSRMMAIVDVYDALISKRCYKSAYPKEEALQIILDNAGTQFDPVLANLFVREMKKSKSLYLDYPT